MMKNGLTHKDVEEYGFLNGYEIVPKKQYADLLEALKAVNRRLWERRFDFSKADHAAMDAASEVIRKAREK